jgi:DUF4097 and DUF4098 domain-containing protein YvlB
MELANTEEINLDNVNTIEIAYHSEKVSLFQGTTDRLVIKEYRNRIDSKFNAHITNAGDKLTIERGWRLSFRLFYIVYSRIEIYLPASYKNALSIKTTSGKIEVFDEYSLSKINLESTSGSISVNTIIAEMSGIKTTSGGIHGENINGDVDIRTSSGAIKFGNIKGNATIGSSSGAIDINQVTGNLTARSTSGSINCKKAAGNTEVSTTSGKIVLYTINGEVSTESTSGRIELNLVNCGVTAKNSSGGIYCIVNGNAGNISLATTSGGIGLDLPKDLVFNFSSKTSSGSLSTPFRDRLFIPVSDKKLVEGVIGGENIPVNSPHISIKTTSGAMNINWIN